MVSLLSLADELEIGFETIEADGMVPSAERKTRVSFKNDSGVSLREEPNWARGTMRGFPFEDCEILGKYIKHHLMLTNSIFLVTV